MMHGRHGDARRRPQAGRPPSGRPPQGRSPPGRSPQGRSPKGRPARRASIASVTTFALRLLVFGAMWWFVSEGDTPFAVVPSTVIVLAAGASVRVLPARSNPLRWGGVALFVPWFLVRVFTGGLDVARRAWSPRMPIEPGFVDVPIRLRSTPARVALAWAVSLMPGTASTTLAEDRLIVHALDRSLPVTAMVADLERRLAAAFVNEEA